MSKPSVFNQQKLYDIIGDWVKTLTAEEGIKLLDDAGIPADLVRDISELANDPHMLEREAVLAVEDPEKGKVLVPGVFPKLKNHPGRVKHLGGKLGEHNKEIYEDKLGLTPEEISQLKEEGTI